MHTPMDMDMFSWSFVRPVDQARFEQKWTRTDGTIFLFSVHAVAAASWSAQTAACARSRYSFQVSHSGTRRWRSCGGILACADHVSAFSVSLQNSPSANKHAEYIWIQIKMFISIIPFLPFAGALLHSLVLFLFFFFSSPTVLCSLQLWVCNSSSTNPLKTEHQIHLSNLLILHCITGFIIWAFVLFIPLAACAGVFWTQCRVHVLLLFDS